MNVLEFLKKITPNFRKSTVEKELELVGNCYNMTKRAYDDYEPLFKSWTFKGQKYDRLNNIFGQHYRSVSKNENMITVVLRSLDEGQSLAKNLKELVKRRFQENIAKDGLSYQDTNILQMCSLLRFHDAYARRLLSYVSIVETGQFDKGYSIQNHLTQEHETFIVNNAQPFFKLVQLLATTTTNEILSKFKKVPDLVVIADNDAALQSHRGQRDLDPFGMNFIATSWNPAVFIGDIFDGLAIKRYKEAEEECTMLELRLLNMRNMQAGSPNPKVQEQIIYTEARLARVRAEIEEFETEYL